MYFKRINHLLTYFVRLMTPVSIYILRATIFLEANVKDVNSYVVELNEEGRQPVYNFVNFILMKLTLFRFTEEQSV